MNTPIIFTERGGAHFRISKSEFDALDGIAKVKYESELKALPIGKATTILRAIILASGAKAVVENEEGRVVASAEMDGADATTAVIGNLFDPHLKHAVMDIGRVTVDVVRSKDVDVEDALPVDSFEYRSRAYTWSQGIVGRHRDALYEDGIKTPTVVEDQLPEMPPRAEISLAIQGLALQPSGNVGELEIVRLTQMD